MTEAGLQVLTEVASFVTTKVNTLRGENKSHLLAHYQRLLLLDSSNRWATEDSNSIGTKSAVEQYNKLDITGFNQRNCNTPRKEHVLFEFSSY